MKQFYYKISSSWHKESAERAFTNCGIDASNGGANIGIYITSEVDVLRVVKELSCLASAYVPCCPICFGPRDTTSVFMMFVNTEGGMDTWGPCKEADVLRLLVDRHTEGAQRFARWAETARVGDLIDYEMGTILKASGNHQKMP